MCRRLRPLRCSRATARARSAGTHSLLAVVAFVFADLLPLIETGIDRKGRACVHEADGFAAGGQASAAQADQALPM